MLKKLLLTGKHSSSVHIGILVLRVCSGAAMLTHGYPKFIKVLNGEWQFGDPLGIGVEASLILAAFAEFICSILLILGLTTRYALIPLIITMLVAWRIAHVDDPFGSQEKSVLYLVIFLATFIIGPGKYSLDQKLFN